VTLHSADFVLGRKIEIVSGDDQNKPDVGLGIVRRWFDVENVGIVTGLGNSRLC
jgi:branched-chain amino acid transport system substrate-binding protein